MARSRIRSVKTKLHGNYRAPRFRIGSKVNCEVRGQLRIIGVTDAPIPGRWALPREAEQSRSLCTATLCVPCGASL